MTMLSCKELSEKASDYLDGELSPWGRMQIRLHMFLCEHCRRYLRQMRLAVDALALAAGSDKGEDAGEDRILRALSLSPTIDPPREGIALPEVVIYTTSWCPYCRSAKALLDRKGVDYVEIGVGGNPAKRRKMAARARGRTSVPQIFIGGRAIGGSDELRALQASGELDRLLGRA
jgi:glutaredoxin 3